ncbi:MAG: hypothetical protein GX616_19965 [Planctomycetes bacterium]|nr:hypothetical protein [Planctomycetota bacterium]
MPDPPNNSDNKDNQEKDLEQGEQEKERAIPRLPRAQPKSRSPVRGNQIHNRQDSDERENTPGPCAAMLVWLLVRVIAGHDIFSRLSCLSAMLFTLIRGQSLEDHVTDPDCHQNSGGVGQQAGDHRVADLADSDGAKVYRDHIESRVRAAENRRSDL